MRQRHLGQTAYQQTWHAMQAFTHQRTLDTPDEIWVTEHAPVYTLGLNRKGVRMPWREDIPVVQTDRGGKITYHGPGQLVVYLLLDLKRRGWNVRHLVDCMEQSIVRMLADDGVAAENRPDAPGVYVAQGKIASLGLRIKNGRCYHGLSLNVDMDLSPFAAIDPCGYRGLTVTQTRDIGMPDDIATLQQRLLAQLTALLG